MIRKILVRDYLKGYGDMTAEERETFVGRVGEWLASDGARLLEITDRPMAKSQSLMTITTRWTKEDVAATERGISLLSALAGMAETWLPQQVYMRSAYRAVRQVYIILNSLVGVGVKGKADGLNVAINPITGAPMPKTNNTTTSGRGAAAHYNQEPKRAAGAGAGKPQALPSPVVAGAVSSPSAKQQGSEAAQTKKPLPTIKTVGKEYDAATNTVRVQCAVMPARPKHIDQYVHLLPKATQERAAGYGELMRQLGEARDNMQLLMDDDHASAKSREQWAKQATRIDKKIRALREELDREWDKVVADNRIALDAFGNAYVVEMRNEKGEMRNGDAAADTSLTSDLSPLTSELSSEQRKRRRDLRKWLIDLRRGKEGKDREKRIEQWRVNWQEYLTLEPREKAMEDEKILEAAKHFDIDLTQIVTN